MPNPPLRHAPQRSSTRLGAPYFLDWLQIGARVFRRQHATSLEKRKRRGGLIGVGPSRSFLVLHRAWPDLQRMKLLLLCACVVGTEVGVFLVRLSPFSSWTRGSWSTSDCRHGPSSAPEHAS